MISGRRSFLRLLAVSPIAGKAAAEAAAARLSGLEIGGVDGVNTRGIMPSSVGDPTPDDHLRILSMPGKRTEIRSMLFERERRVSSIDPDIACHRSWSLNAKIAFQRQRNVEEAMREMVETTIWRRIDNFIRDSLKPF